MTVSVQTPFTAATANGVTTVFPYAFRIIDQADLDVTLDGVLQTTGFTVSGIGDDIGGNVTFDVAPDAGVAVLLARDPVLERDTDYAQFGKLPASVLNTDLDRVWLALQKFANDFTRSLKLPVDTLTDQLIDSTPGERANALVTFDGSGNLTITPMTSIAVNVSGGSFTVDTFDGTGAQTAFTLSRDPGILNNTSVFVGGAYIRKDQYSISGTTLTFDVAPASGTDNIEVCQSVALEAGSPADGTVTLSSLIDGVLAASAAGLAKMGDGFLAASTAGRAKMADKFVTLAKIADIATGKLLGNVSGGSAAPAEISEASQAEAEDGTLQTRWMTPLRTAQSIAAKKTVPMGAEAGAGLATVSFTGLPSGLNNIRIVFDDLSTNGTSNICVRLGTGGVADALGYDCVIASNSNGVVPTVGSNDTGLLLSAATSAGSVRNGIAELVRIDGNTWVLSYQGIETSSLAVQNSGAHIVLGGVLDSLFITTVGGVNTFDGATKINVVY